LIMGRPAKYREPVERAVLDLLAGGVAMKQRVLFAEVRERTKASVGKKASDGTIRKWGRKLCVLDKRGGPGDASAAWWWSLAPEIAGTDPNIAGIEPKIMQTRGVDASAPKMTVTQGQAHDQPGTRSLNAQHRVRGHAPEIAGTGGPSLLDGHHKRSEAKHANDRANERQVTIKAFGRYLANRGRELHTLNLTVPTGYPSIGAAVGLGSWVARLGGGFWLVPQAAEGTDHEHNHGMFEGVPPGLIHEAWVRLTGGAASRDLQRTEPIYDVSGWLDYCRRAPGFALDRVIALGSLYGPWTWALGRAEHMPPDPHDLPGLSG